MIILSETYRLTYDPNNVILQFFETRIRKDGVTPYEYVEETYHPTVAVALRAFLHKSTKYSQSIEDVLKRIKSVEEKIDQISELQTTS